MNDPCKKKDCAYWRDTPLGDSHHKCITCSHSSWLPKSDKDNYKPNNRNTKREKEMSKIIYTDENITVYEDGSADVTCNCDGGQYTVYEKSGWESPGIDVLKTCCDCDGKGYIKTDLSELAEVYLNRKTS